MKPTLYYTLALCLCTFFSPQLFAQQESSPILFIYDASGSMWGKMESKTKKEIAASVLSKAVNKLSANQPVGLMAYGHRKKGDCNDVEILLNLENTSKEKVISAVAGINPLGRTPLARSAIMAIDNLKKSNTKATVILITDGIESCDGNICEVVQNAKSAGVDFRLHIIGFGIEEGNTEQLLCAANAGDGRYYDAKDAAGLGEMLEQATAQSVDDPQDNFSIAAFKNGAPIDAIVVAYAPGTRSSVDESRTYRDTGFLHLPPGKYDVIIRPLENTDLAETAIQISIQEGEILHEDISFDAATLTFEITNNGEGWDAVVKVLDANSGKVVATSRTYGRSQFVEVNPGTYDINIQALVFKGEQSKTKIEQISVKASEQKSISHNFETGIAKIGVSTSSGELIDATVNFRDMATNKNVAGSRTYTSSSSNPKEFILTPGTYQVKIVTLGKHKGNSKTLTVEIKAGETLEKIVKF